ncbi:MAG: epimerase [Calditrichaeota bacterium]|nr:MAG: epimerase [Calditrichota bacterium]
MKINVIVFGATGMVGEGVLLTALNHDQVESVLVIGRRACQVMHPKLKELIHDDFFNYSAIELQLKGYNACFFCLGVSSLGMKEDDYSRVTYDLTMAAAKTLSRLNPDMTFCYVSGTGTDSTERGRLMWARVKGKTENDLTKLPFKAVYLFRPGLLKPVKDQKNVRMLFKVMAWPYPLLKLLFPQMVCTLHDLGLAMINVCMAGYSKPILENLDIARVAAD